MDLIFSFEKKLEKAFSEVSGLVRGQTVLAAVSGGADSMAMLTALVRISGKLGCSVRVITVNHNIRPEQESAADALYVAEYCKGIENIPCTAETLPCGFIARLARQRKRGIEEAARFARYKLFAAEAEKTNAALVCLAHTRNDMLETILQHFFQGGNFGLSQGIPKRRGIFFRPMLSFSRSEITAYLAALNVSFRTDKTNFDDKYFRNRIRSKIIPVLDEYVPGWQTAVLHGMEKSADAAAVVDAAADAAEWQRCRLDAPKKGAACADSGGIYMDRKKFFEQPAAVRLRLLCRGLLECGCNERIPYAVMKKVMHAKGNLTICSCGFTFTADKNRIFINNASKNRTNNKYFGIIEKCGMYKLPDGELSVRLCSRAPDALWEGPIKLPAAVCVANGSVKTYQIGQNTEECVTAWVRFIDATNCGGY
ncbi:MAG: tRNA lysidine(34) synthetase TilS [Bacteroides sp.]|nr:tRNA lysidine(34) synthetase TilS [Prevotella sp.]MCM1408345.1 tRNA lysidine(34) synthetase TilS [Treponema brennaborense]MCM1470423.1 tRNA lysidine(34) synthetase TilS [Bacteroides sp.]